MNESNKMDDADSPHRSSQQKPRNEIKFKTKKLWQRILLFLTAIIVLAAIIIIYTVKENVNQMIIPKSEVATEINTIQESPSINEDNRDVMEDFYILILGLDYRDQHNALLTDSILVLHVIPQEPIIKLLSIPRDLLTENSKGYSVKINALFSEGITIAKQKAEEAPNMLTGENVKLGNKELDKAVISGAIANTRNKIDELLDITIDYSVIVNFNTVIALVDEVGGIEIDVKRSMKYTPTNLDLQPGLQTLNGEDALGYARFREDDRGPRYYSSDFERGLQQQEVIKALAQEISSWKNLGKALQLLEITSKNIQTDMDLSSMYDMITNYYHTFNSSSFVSIPFPENYSSSGDVIITNDDRTSLQNTFKSLDKDF